MQNKQWFTVATVCAAVSATPEALAYIDPGTGSMLIQSAIAALIGIAFAFRNGVRTTLHWIAQLFRKDDAEPPRDGGTPPGDEPPAGSGR